ncbi:MAG: hypothetical protein GX070_03775 [Alcaligenaceae bacterium]|nr:hypothetical protein [Alcaligenaceae bacterium]
MKKLILLLLPFTCYANTTEPATAKLQQEEPDRVILRDKFQKLSFKRHYENVIRITTSYLRPTAPEHLTSLYYSDYYRVVKENQTVEHLLPEGGMLTYRHDSNNKITEILWTPQYSFKPHPILTTKKDTPGYLFGNELVLRAQAGSPGKTQLSLWNAYQKKPLWAQELVFAPDGTLATEKTSLPAKKLYSNTRYSYNARQQLETATVHARYYQKNLGQQYHYAWNPDGSRTAGHNNHTDITPETSRNPNGFPVSTNNHLPAYDNGRKPVKIKLSDHTEAIYTYNAYGQRIRKQFKDNKHQKEQTVFFYYDNNRLVGEWSLPPGSQKQRFNSGALINRRYIYAGQLPVAFIEYDNARLYDYHTDQFLDPNIFSKSTPFWMIPYLNRLDGATLQRRGRLFFIHADHIGQPFMVTDENRNIRWLAQNSPTGQSNILYEGIEFNLRLPGQYFDKETGWHYNGQRYYDPAAGHYLEPHPHEEQTGLPPFTYASHQPRRFIDPLALFPRAFDEQGINKLEFENNNIKHVKALYLEGSDYYAEPQTLLNRANLNNSLKHSGKNKTKNTNQSTNSSATNPPPHKRMKSTGFLGPHENIAGTSPDSSIQNPPVSTKGKYSDHASLPLTWVDWIKINYGNATCLPHWVKPDPPLIYPEDDPNLKHYYHHPDLGKQARERVEQLIGRIPANIPWLSLPLSNSTINQLP